MGLTDEDVRLRVSDDTKFCVDCGSKIHVRAEICPKCGIRQMVKSQIQAVEEVSNWWYLACFLGIIGGFVAYYVNKDKDPVKANYFWYIGFAFTIVAIAFSMSGW